MPKLGMGPIRREQICRAAAVVISREGFAGTTMRLVADEAGVSTGMLNHYFANRQDLLTNTLTFVSEGASEQMRTIVEALPPGRDRLAALLDSVLAENEEVTQIWRVWISAYAEAVRVPELRRTIEMWLTNWFELLDRALEGLVPAAEPDGVPWSWRVDALLNGLTIRALTSELGLDRTQVRDEVIRLLLDGRPGERSEP